MSEIVSSSLYTFSKWHLQTIIQCDVIITTIFKKWGYGVIANKININFTTGLQLSSLIALLMFGCLLLGSSWFAGISTTEPFLPTYHNYSIIPSICSEKFLRDQLLYTDNHLSSYRAKSKIINSKEQCMTTCIILCQRSAGKKKGQYG